MRGMTRSLALAFSLALGVAACSHNPKPNQKKEQELPVTVRVENQAFSDMTIYVLNGGQRVRLGMATGNSTARFRVPQSMIFGLTSLQFQAHPIGGTHNPVSQAITVSPGDEVRLTIPPG